MATFGRVNDFRRFGNLDPWRPAGESPNCPRPRRLICSLQPCRLIAEAAAARRLVVWSSTAKAKATPPRSIAEAVLKARRPHLITEVATPSCRGGRA